MIIGGSASTAAKRSRLANAEREAGKAPLAIMQARFLQPAIADIPIGDMPSQ